MLSKFSLHSGESMEGQSLLLASFVSPALVAGSENASRCGVGDAELTRARGVGRTIRGFFLSPDFESRSDYGWFRKSRVQALSRAFSHVGITAAGDSVTRAIVNDSGTEPGPCGGNFTFNIMLR